MLPTSSVVPMAVSDSDSDLSPKRTPPNPENSPNKRPKTLTVTRTPSSPVSKLDDCDHGSNSESQSCGICLCSEEGTTNAIIRGRIDSCDHYFCFVCIMEWAKVESRCPLCKRRFTNIRRPPKDGVFLDERVVNVPIRDQVYHYFGNATVRLPDPYLEVQCTMCNSEGDENFLLLCDLCDAASHTYCVGLGATIPEGDWFCKDCTISKSEHDKSETGTYCDRPMSFRRSGARPPVEEHASVLAVRRESRFREVERRSTRVSAHPNHLSTPISSERRTNPELGARTLRRCRNVQGRIQELRENWNAFRSGSLSFTSGSRSADPAGGTIQRKSSSDILSGRSQPHSSGNTKRDNGSYDVVKAWKMLDAAKSMEQVHERASICHKASKDTLSKVITPIEKANPSSSLLASSSKHLGVKDLAKNGSKKHIRCYSPVKATERHKSHIDFGQKQGMVTKKRILKIGDNSPSSQSAGDHIYPSVLVNVCHGNGGKLTEESLRAQSADGLHEHDRSGCFVSPAGRVTSGSITTCAKLGKSFSSMRLPNEKATMGKSYAGSSSRRDDDAKSEIQSLVKLNLKLLTRDRTLGVDAFKEIARLSTHSILAACGLEGLKSGVPSFPSFVCCHTDEVETQQLRRMSTLVPACCTECFSVFVKDVVNALMVEKLGPG